jgi:predicted RNA methylase
MCADGVYTDAYGKGACSSHGGYYDELNLVSDSDLENLFYQDYYIGEYLLSNKINRNDFIRYGDRNLLAEKRNWINKSATPLDVAAHSLTNQLNVEVTPQDFIDIVLDYKSPKEYILSLREKAVDTIKRQQGIFGINAIYKSDKCPEFILCADGTFSTKKGKGSCSYHGGVAIFEKEGKKKKKKVKKLATQIEQPKQAPKAVLQPEKKIPITEQTPKYKMGDFIAYTAPGDKVAHWWEIGFVNYYAGNKWKGTYRLQRYLKGKSIQVNDVYEDRLIPISGETLRSAKVLHDLEKNYVEKKKYNVPAPGDKSYIVNQPLTRGAKEVFNTSTYPYKVKRGSNWAKQIWFIPTIKGKIQLDKMIELQAAQKEGFTLHYADTATSARVYYLARRNETSILTPIGAKFYAGAYTFKDGNLVKKPFCDLTENEFIQYLYATPKMVTGSSKHYQYETSHCMVDVYDSRGSKHYRLCVWGKDNKPSYDFNYEKSYPTLYEALKAAYWVYKVVYECEIAKEKQQAPKTVLMPEKEVKTIVQPQKGKLLKYGTYKVFDPYFIVNNEYAFLNKDIDYNSEYERDGNLLVQYKVPSNRKNVKGQKYFSNGTVKDAIELIEDVEKVIKKPGIKTLKNPYSQFLDIVFDYAKKANLKENARIIYANLTNNVNENQFRSDMTNKFLSREHYINTIWDYISKMPVIAPYITRSKIIEWYNTNLLFALKDLVINKKGTLDLLNLIGSFVGAAQYYDAIEYFEKNKIISVGVKVQTTLDKKLKKGLDESGFILNDKVNYRRPGETKQRLGQIYARLDAVGQFVILESDGNMLPVFPASLKKVKEVPQPAQPVIVETIKEEVKSSVKPEIVLIDPTKDAVGNIWRLFVRSYNTEWDNAAQLHEAFKAAYDLKDQFKAELGKYKKKQLLKLLYNIDPMDYYRVKNEKKQEVVNEIVHNVAIGFLNNYSGVRQISMNSNYRKAPFEYAKERILDEWTEENYQEVKEKKKEKAQAKNKALDNPETLEELRFAAKKRDLTESEQKALERLEEAAILKSAEIIRLRVEKEKEQRKAQLAAAKAVDADVDFTIVDFTHTKTGEELKNVKPNKRVTREEFKDLNNRSYRLGGKRYSKWAKGWLFKTLDQATQFANITQQVEKQEEAIAKDTWTKFRESADKIEQKADDIITSDRKVNTHRRMSMAKGAISDAQGKKWFAGLMRAIADMQENNEAKFLSWMQFQTEIETLLGLERQARWKYIRANERNDINYEKYREEVFNMPFDLRFKKYLTTELCYYAHIFDRFADEAMKVKGAIQFGRKLKKYTTSALKRPRDQQEMCLPSFMLDGLGKALRKVIKDNYSHTVLKEGYRDILRLKKLGLDDNNVLFAAIQELNKAKERARGLQSETKGNIDFELQELRQDKWAKKELDYYPTNDRIAKEMAEMAEIEAGSRVLEPSAGDGALIKAVRQYEPSAVIEAVEIQSKLQEYLKKNGFNVVASDFETFNPSYKYDAIVMNPPFSKRQDAKQVLKAYSLLKPGGKLVAIVGEGSMFASDKNAKALQDLFTTAGIYERKLIGEFKEMGTSVNTRLLVLEGGSVINGFEKQSTWNTRILSSLALGFLFSKAFKQR